jgi:hypothetical protein
MTYDNPNQPKNNDEALLLAQDGIEALISALSYATASNEAAHEPTIRALEQLAIAQAALKKTVQAQTTEQKQTIDRQSKKIEKLQQQIELQNNHLASIFHWRTLTAYTMLSVMAMASSLILLQTFLPHQLDSTTLEKIDFLYRQETKKIPKKKS